MTQSLINWLNSPERRRRTTLLARQILTSQHDRCARCQQPLKFQDAAKQTASFEIICRACYREPVSSITVIDECTD